MVRWMAAGVVAVVLLLAGCGNARCSDACDKMNTCALNASGLSCSDTCAESECAVCLNEKSCSELSSGACATACPNVTITPQ